MSDAVMVKKSFLQKLVEKAQTAGAYYDALRAKAKAQDEAIAKALESAGKRGGARGQMARVGGDLWANKDGFIATAIGALSAYVMTMDMVKKSDWLKKHWYALPLAMLIVGYLFHRKGKPIGKTLMTLGGVYLMQGYQQRPKDDDKKEKEKETSGPDWSDWYPTMAAPQGAQWVVTADGQRVLMPARQYQQYYPTNAALPPKTETADPITQLADEIYRG